MSQPLVEHPALPGQIGDHGAVQVAQPFQETMDRGLLVGLDEKPEHVRRDGVPQLAQLAAQAQVEQLDGLPERRQAEMIGHQNAQPLVLMPGGLEHVPPQVVQQGVHRPIAGAGMPQHGPRGIPQMRQPQEVHLVADVHQAHEPLVLEGVAGAQVEVLHHQAVLAPVVPARPAHVVHRQQVGQMPHVVVQVVIGIQQRRPQRARIPQRAGGGAVVALDAQRFAQDAGQDSQVLDRPPFPLQPEALGVQPLELIQDGRQRLAAVHLRPAAPPVARAIIECR